MTNITTQKINKTEDVQAQLTVMLSLLKANILVELLALLNQLLAAVALVFAQGMLVKILAIFSLLAGFFVFYFALRMRIDSSIFTRWDKLEAQALDAALKQINPNHQADRTLYARLAGTYQLFQRGLYVLILQFGLLIILAWLFLPKVSN